MADTDTRYAPPDASTRPRLRQRFTQLSQLSPAAVHNSVDGGLANSPNRRLAWAGGRCLFFAQQQCCCGRG